MNQFEIYHNPACSKSRATLSLLQSHGIEPRQHLYLQQAPDEKTIRFLVKALGTDVRSIMRNTDEAYKTSGLDNPALTEQALIDALTANPALLQRPIVVCGANAVIGRPPENVLAFISDSAAATHSASHGAD